MTGTGASELLDVEAVEFDVELWVAVEALDVPARAAWPLVAVGAVVTVEARGLAILVVALCDALDPAEAAGAPASAQASTQMSVTGNRRTARG
jgi:hypothetical protein